MSKIIVVENVSLDGVMQSPGRPDEDTRGGFQRGGWASEWLSRDPEAARASMEGQGRTRGLLFGRRTYLDLVGHWLSAGPNPFAEILTATPKYVASSTLAEPLPYPSSELLRGPVTEAVAALKEQDGEGDLVVLGSGMLVRALAAGDLVDEYVLTVIPVVLGGGTRLFGDTYAPLEVARSVTSPTGVVTGTYRVRRD